MRERSETKMARKIVVTVIRSFCAYVIRHCLRWNFNIARIFFFVVLLMSPLLPRPHCFRYIASTILFGNEAVIVVRAFRNRHPCPLVSDITVTRKPYYILQTMNYIANRYTRCSPHNGISIRIKSFNRVLRALLYAFVLRNIIHLPFD